MSFFGDLAQSDLEKFFPESEVKRAYTQDENYRAYKMFSMMDVDNGGAVSLREMKRVLMDEAVRYVSAEFDHPDSGIIFGLDEEKCVIIADIEMDSAATKFPFLIQRMRLYRINDYVVKKHNERALNEVFQELLRLHDEPVRFEFYEPEVIINKFSCFLDLEVDGEVFSVVLPIGAVYNHLIFCDRIHRSMSDTSMMLDHIEVEFIPAKRQILFRSNEEPFRLLFSTGPNYRRSCRYALGFEGEDYPYAFEHAGQPMLMDLQLSVSQAQAEILINELFVKYDRNQSGEFEFEEFRDFYIRYLDSEESLDRLRQYALYRFRDIEKEKFVLDQRQTRINKLKRREFLRAKNAEIVKVHKAKFMSDSYVDAYGNRRRIYRHRTVHRLTAEGDKKITLLKEEAEKAEDAFEEMMKATRTTVVAAMAGKKEGEVAEETKPDTKRKGKNSGNNSVASGSDAEKANDDQSSHQEGFNATVLNKQEAKLRMRFIQKQKQQQQTQRRKEIVRKMIQANRALQAQQRQNARLHQEEGVDMQTLDLHYRIKRELAASVDLGANELYENIQSYGVDVSRLITTPAVKITSAVLGERLDKDSVDVVPYPASTVHPASLYYYHVKENQRSSKFTFDAERFHPSFFTADYVRHPSRHSNLAFGLAKTIHKARQEGVQYRVTHGMEAHIEHVYPPDEDLAAFLQEKQKREEENDPLRHLKKSAAQRKKVSFAEIEPVGQRGLVGRLTILSIKLENLSSMHAFAKNSPFVNVYVGSNKFVTEAYSYAGSVCEWDDLNWVIRLFKKDTFQLDVFSGGTTNYSYIGSHSLTSQQVLDIQYEVDNVIVIQGKLYNQELEMMAKAKSNKKNKNEKRNKKDANVEEIDDADNRKVTGIFHIRANLEKGQDWDWFIQSYEKTQARAERLAAERKRLSSTYTGPKQWLNIHTYFPLEIQIVDVILYDVNSSLASWIFKSRITMTLDAGRSEYTTDDNYAVVHSQDSAEWQKLQWEFLVENPEVNLIYKIYAHGKYIGRYILSAATLAEKLTATTHELEFTGELVVLVGPGDAKIVGKVMTKMLVNPRSGLEITRYREMNPTKATIEDHLRPDYLVALPAVFLFEKAELSATNLHSITFSGTYILRLHYEHYKFETKIEVSTRTKRVIIPSIDWQIPMHERKKVTIILEHIPFLSAGSITQEIPAVVHFQTDEFCALEKNAESGIVIRKFVFVDNEIKAKIAFYATVSLERDHTAIDRLLFDTDPVHNLRVVDPVYTKDGVLMVEGNQEFWEMQGKYYRSSDKMKNKLPSLGNGEEESKKSTNNRAHLTLDDLRGSTTSLLGLNDTSASSVHTGNPVLSNNVSLPVTMQVSELLVTDLYSVHYLSKNSPRVHIIFGSQGKGTTVSHKSGAHAFWSGLDMTFSINNYDTPIRLSVDSQESVIGECLITIPDLFASRPNKTGMREILSTLTWTMKNQKQQATHQIRGKVKVVYFLDQANKLGIPTSDIQLGALKFIDYPVQLVVHHITVANLRRVHLFGRNSPLVKMTELGADYTKFYTTTMLKQAGGYGKWMQLMWSSVIRNDVTSFHFQVLSESMVIGSAEVIGDTLLRMVPNSQGVCETVLPLVGIEDHLRGGEIQITYSYEPYIEEEINDEIDGDEYKAFDALTNDEGKAGIAAAGSSSLIGPSSSSSYVGLFQSGPNRPQLSSPFTSSSSLLRPKSSLKVATDNDQVKQLQVSADLVKEHRLVMICAIVIVLRKPKAKKVAASKNHRASNPEEYPIWNLSTTRAQVVCGKYVHAVRLKCQQLLSTSQTRKIWNDQDSSDGNESFISEDTRNNRNNSSIILRSAPLIEKFVMSDKKPLYLRLFDGNDLTIGDGVYNMKDVIETSPVNAAGFHICDQDLWKDGELVGLIRLQARVSTDIPPIIRATLIDGNLSLGHTNSVDQRASLDVHHPSLWTAERRLTYPLGVRFNHIAVVDISEEDFIPEALLQLPTTIDEGHEDDKEESGTNFPPSRLKLNQVEIFLRIRFSGELRSSMTTFALSSDVYEAGLVWEFLDNNYSIAHDQEIWIFEVIALGKIIGICKIPAFDLRYARELHLRQVADENGMIANDLEISLPDSTLYFNVWNAQKKVTSRLLLKFRVFELFPSSEDSDRLRSLQMIATTPRSSTSATQKIPPTISAHPSTSTILGFVRFTFLHAYELRQIYSMFPNSPRVKITIGERVYETKVLGESGGEGIWDQLSWGRINLRQNIPMITITVLSNNEIIGSWEMSVTDMLESIRRAKEFAMKSNDIDANNGENIAIIDDSGTVIVQLSGILWKNRRMMGKMMIRFLGHLQEESQPGKATDGVKLKAENALMNRAKSFFSRPALPIGSHQPHTGSNDHQNSTSLVIGERSSTIVMPAADPEGELPPSQPETAIAPDNSFLSSQASMDGIPLPMIENDNTNAIPRITSRGSEVSSDLQQVMQLAEVQHHPQNTHNSYASSYNGNLPPPGGVAPQNTMTSSTSLFKEPDALTLPEVIDFQFVALSISHVRRNPNEEDVQFSFKNPPKLHATCGGWSAETVKLSTVSESSVTTQFKWLVSRYPAWRFQTEGTPFLKVSLQTSDTKRLMGTVFVSMSELLQMSVDHIGLMHIGRTLMSPNDEPIAHLEIVYRVIVRIQEDQPPPWWITTGMDPNRMNQSWSLISATVSNNVPRPDRAATFAHLLPNPTAGDGDDESKSLYSSASTLSMNTLHLLTAGDRLADFEANDTGTNDYNLVVPVLKPPFILVITRAALTEIRTPGWMMESDAIRNLIVIRAFTRYAGYATSTIATVASEVYWEELEGHVDDTPLPAFSLPPTSPSQSLISGSQYRSASPSNHQSIGDGEDDIFEPITKDKVWQFRFFDLKENMQMEVFNLAKPFGSCSLNAQEILKLPRTIQGEVDIRLPVRYGKQDSAQLHFTGRILPIPTQEDPSEEKTVASIAAELQAIERNEHLGCIMRLKYISCEDISLMAHEIRIKMVSEHEGTQMSPSLKNLYGRVQYAPTSWQDVKFYQRSLVTLSVVNHQGDVLGASTVDMYDVQRAPVDQRPLTTASNVDDISRPATTASSPDRDAALANWVDTGSQSPRSQRRRRRRLRHQNIAVMYLDLILGPAKRGRIALAFERLAPSQYHTALNDDATLSARSDITDDTPVVRELAPGWGININHIRLSHLKPVHQFGKNSPLVTLDVTGKKFQTDCLAFAGKKATYDGLSWMLDCREKVVMKFKVTSASVTVGTCSILMDELFVHPLDKHYELEVERKLVKDKVEMGKIVLRLQGHPPLPPLSTNTGYIDSSGSIVTIRTQGDNQTMKFRPVELSKNPEEVDYQLLLMENMEGYRLMQEMDVQTMRSLTLQSSTAMMSSSLDSRSISESKSQGTPHSRDDYDNVSHHEYDDSSTIRTLEESDVINQEDYQAMYGGIDDVEQPSFHSGGDQHSKHASSSAPESVNSRHSTHKSSLKSGSHARSKDEDASSHNSKVQFSVSRISGLPPTKSGSVLRETDLPPNQPLSGSLAPQSNNNQMLTSRSWDGGISNQPAAAETVAGRPRTSRGPDLPRFLPKLDATVDNQKMMSSASLPSLSSQRRSSLTAVIPRSKTIITGNRRFSLGSALEGTVSIVEGSLEEGNPESIVPSMEKQENAQHDNQNDSKEASSHHSHQQSRRNSDGSSLSYACAADSSAASYTSTAESSQESSTIAYANPQFIGDADADASIYSQYTRGSSVSGTINEEDRSYEEDLSMPNSARTEASSAYTSYSSRSTSRSGSAASSTYTSRTSTAENTPRIDIDMDNEENNDLEENCELQPSKVTIMGVNPEDNHETDEQNREPRSSTIVIFPSRTQPLRSILKPSQMQQQSSGEDEVTETTATEDEENNDEEEEEEEEDQDEVDASETSSVASSSSSTSTSSSSTGQSLTPFSMTHSELEEQVSKFPIPPLRLLFLRDEKPLPREKMALLIATDLTRGLIVQVVSSFVAMQEGTSFMGARRQVANSLLLDFDQVPIAQRRVLTAVDFVRQIAFTASTQAYQKLVVRRRMADIEAEIEAHRVEALAEKERRRAKNKQLRQEEGKIKKTKKKKESTKGKDVVIDVTAVNPEVVATSSEVKETEAKEEEKKSSSPTPGSPSHRKTLVKRLSTYPSPKANMKKRQAVIMTSGLTNPVDGKRQKDQEWSDKLEKELERKAMLSKPTRARIRIMDVLGIDLATIDPQVRPTRPYLTACKPFGNWAAETTVVKLEVIKPLPPALQEKRAEGYQAGKTDDEISLPSIWKETIAHDAGEHPITSSPSAYMLNFTELYGKYRWEEFVLRMGQDMMLEIRDAGSNLVVAKTIVPYSTIISKLPGDQEIFESSLFLVFNVANEFGGGKLSAIMRVRLDLSVNVFVRTKKSASFWDQHRAQHWLFYPLTPINFGAVRQKFREIAEDYDKQRLVHPSYFGFKVRIRGNEEDEGRFLHPVFSGYNLAKKLAIAKSAAKDARVQAMKTRAANPFRFDPGLKDIGKCPICGDGLPGCPRCFMMPTKEFDGSFHAPQEFAYDPAAERKRALVREQRVVALKAKRRRRLTSLQYSSVADLNLESLGLSKVLSHDKIMTTGMSMADISKEINKMFDKELDSEVTQEEQREQAKLRKLHTRLTTFQSIRASRLSMQRMLNIFVKIMPTGNTVRILMDANDAVHLLYDRFNWHYPTNKNHHPMMLLPTSQGYFELHSEISWENEMEIADNRGYDKIGTFFQIQEQTCRSFVVLYYAHYVPQAVAPMVQSFFAANTTFSLRLLPTYASIDRTPKDLVKDEVQMWYTKVISMEYQLQQEENKKFFINLGKAFHGSSMAAKQKEVLLRKQEKIFQAQQKKLIQQRFASQLKRLGTGASGARDTKSRQKILETLESRERNKRKTRLFVDEKDNLLQTVKEDADGANRFGDSKQRLRSNNNGDDDDDDMSTVLSLSAVQFDDFPLLDNEEFDGSEYSDGDGYSDSHGSGSEYSYSQSGDYSTSSYYSDEEGSRSRQSHTEVSVTSKAESEGNRDDADVENDDDNNGRNQILVSDDSGKLIPGGDAATAAAILKQHQREQAKLAKTFAQFGTPSHHQGMAKRGSPKRKLSTIPSLSLPTNDHSSTSSAAPNDQYPPSELSFSARSLTSHLTESDYGSSSYYTYDDDDSNSYYDDDYDSVNDDDFHSLSDVERSIGSRTARPRRGRQGGYENDEYSQESSYYTENSNSDYTYSPQNSSRSARSDASSSSYGSSYYSSSSSPRSYATSNTQSSYSTSATPYSLLSQQSLQPYPSTAAEEDSLPAANLVAPLAGNGNSNNRTQLSHNQQLAQRRLQSTLREETIQLQDQLLGNRLPSTLELSITDPQDGGYRQQDQTDVKLDIQPDNNGGMVPVQDVDDAMSIFSGHRLHQFPTAQEKRAMERLMASKKKTATRVLRPHEDVYGVGMDAPIAAGGNANDDSSMYSHRQHKDDDLDDDDDGHSDDISSFNKVDDEDSKSFYSLNTMDDSRTQDNQSDMLSTTSTSTSVASSSAGLFTFRDDVSLPSHQLYGDMDEEENIMSIQSMPSEDESYSRTSKNMQAKNNKRKTKQTTMSGAMVDTSYHQYLQGGQAAVTDDGDNASLYSAAISTTSSSSEAASSSLPSSSHSTTNSSTTYNSSNVSKQSKKTQKKIGHPRKQRISPSRQHPPSVPPTIQDISESDYDDDEDEDHEAGDNHTHDGEDEDDIMSQVTFQTQESMPTSHNNSFYSKYADADDGAASSRTSGSLFSQHSGDKSDVSASSASATTRSTFYSNTTPSSSRGGKSDRDNSSSDDNSSYYSASQVETSRNTQLNRQSSVKIATSKNDANSSGHNSSDDYDDYSSTSSFVSSASSAQSGSVYSNSDSSSYVTASEGYPDDSRSSTNNTYSSSDTTSKGSAIWLGAQSLLAPLTATPSTSASYSTYSSYSGKSSNFTADSHSMNHKSRLTASTSAYSGYGYLDESTEDLPGNSKNNMNSIYERDDDEDSLLSEYTEDERNNRSHPHHRTSSHGNNNDNDDDDNSSVLSDSSYASSLSNSSSSFVRKKKALRVIAQEMSELGDTDILDPVAAAPVVEKPAIGGERSALSRIDDGSTLSSMGSIDLV